MKKRIIKSIEDMKIQAKVPDDFPNNNILVEEYNENES